MIDFCLTVSYAVCCALFSPVFLQLNYSTYLQYRSEDSRTSPTTDTMSSLFKITTKQPYIKKPTWQPTHSKNFTRHQNPIKNSINNIGDAKRTDAWKDRKERQAKGPRLTREDIDKIRRHFGGERGTIICWLCSAGSKDPARGHRAQDCKVYPNEQIQRTICLTCKRGFHPYKSCKMTINSTKPKRFN